MAGEKDKVNTTAEGAHDQQNPPPSPGGASPSHAINAIANHLSPGNPGNEVYKRKMTLISDGTGSLDDDDEAAALRAKAL